MNYDGFDALLFDLGGVVIDIDFQRAFARWAETTSCNAALCESVSPTMKRSSFMRPADLLMTSISKAFECLSWN
jgi:hypothetical protein